MPSGDRSGPMGEGPRTGKQAGYCSGNDAPGYAEFGYGRPGFGRRHFWRRYPRRHAPWPVRHSESDDEERKSLLQEMRELKDLVSGLQKKVDQLDK